MSATPDGRRPVTATAFLAAGPVEVLDFLVPLWAGAVLALPPITTGTLVATGALSSVLVRPLAGRAVDAGVATVAVLVGALSLAAGALTFALASSVTTAFVASVVAGAGAGALGPGLGGWAATGAGDDVVGRYGRLVSAENEGALVGYVVCLALVGPVGYGAAFALLGLAAIAGALVVLVAVGARRPHLPAPRDDPPTADGSAAALGPLLVVCAVTAAAEAGTTLALVVHLQQTLGLAAGAVALVLAPGFVAFVVGPRLAPTLDHVLDRGRALVTGLAVTALAAGCLGLLAATAPGPLGPVAVAVTWTVVGGVLGVALPLEMAVVTRSAPGRVGRALGRYELARIAGGGVGAVALTGAYEVGGLGLVGAVAAAAVGAAALAGGPAVRALPGSTRRRAPDPGSGSGGACPGEDAETLRARARTLRRHWVEHLGLFAVAQTVLWVLDASAFRYDLTGALPTGPEWLTAAGRIWTIVLAVDTVLAWGRAAGLDRRARRAEVAS